MVNFKSIADKAKGVFKKPKKQEGETTQPDKKPNELLSDIKKYEEKISKKDYSGDSGTTELKEEVDAGIISKESYKEVMDALDIKDEGVTTEPKAGEAPKPVEASKDAPKDAPKPVKTEEKSVTKSSGVVISPKKDEMPSERIMRAMGTDGEDKLDRMIELLEDIRDSLSKKKKPIKKPKKAKKPAKKKK